uniref:Uncharacterized protein n=1 Tax=Anguilla anguilla TaxID=7936 RepID=A0A0E9Q157_ANGAN
MDCYQDHFTKFLQTSAVIPLVNVWKFLKLPDIILRVAQTVYLTDHEVPH